jgi:4-hydroxy-2-oxoheptanedioate aldolase
MRTSLISSPQRQDKAVRITFVYYPVAMMPIHSVQAGFDVLCLDAEHNTWGRPEIQRIIALHHLASIDCLVRTGSRNPNELYHLLEDGVSALMIPLVNTPEDAAVVAAAVKFPPLGGRGLDGGGLDNNCLLRGTENYLVTANAETFLIVQIETAEALADLDRIASTSGDRRAFYRTWRPRPAVRLSLGVDSAHADRRRGRGRRCGPKTRHLLAPAGGQRGVHRPYHAQRWPDHRPCE